MAVLGNRRVHLQGKGEHTSARARCGGGRRVGGGGRVLDRQVTEPPPSVTLGSQSEPEILFLSRSRTLADADTGSSFPARVKRDTDPDGAPAELRTHRATSRPLGWPQGDLRGVHWLADNARLQTEKPWSPFTRRADTQTPTLRLRDAAKRDRSGRAPSPGWREPHGETGPWAGLWAPVLLRAGDCAQANPASRIPVKPRVPPRVSQEPRVASFRETSAFKIQTSLIQRALCLLDGRALNKSQTEAKTQGPKEGRLPTHPRGSLAGGKCLEKALREKRGVRRGGWRRHTWAPTPDARATVSERRCRRAKRVTARARVRVAPGATVPGHRRPAAGPLLPYFRLGTRVYAANTPPNCHGRGRRPLFLSVK